MTNLSELPATSPLFPQPGYRDEIETLLSGALAGAEERIAAGRVTPAVSCERFRDELARFDFQAPEPLEELVPWLVARLENGITHVTHPRYFGLFNPPPTHASQCADRIVAVFNPQLATATTSPIPVEIERHVIRAVAARAGLPPDASGHFTSGGSEANATALVCALTAAHPEFARRGGRCFAGQPCIYISREAHLAWLKIAHMTGIGRDGVRQVATDGSGRMSAEALAGCVEADRREGCVPVMIVGTAGTTGAGMVDPLPACAEAARRAGAWYHVDAAWAGAAIASEQMRDLLSGTESADSVTIDAHKWFAATMGCGMFLTSKPAVLSRAFEAMTSYMPSNLPLQDPYVSSMQWSRRFLGARLFLSLGAVGWRGYALHVERAVRVADTIHKQLADLGWSLANTSPVAVLCLEPPSGSADVRTIVQRVLASGSAYVSVARFEGRETVRVCVTHGATSSRDISILVQVLESSRRADWPPLSGSQTETTVPVSN
jgi:glutamate/tyrosine decarboxylase-like PLP-dependent enzyme